jgi:hypothetical protein
VSRSLVVISKISTAVAMSVVIAAVCAAPLRAQCNYTTLENGVHQGILGSPKFLSIEQSAGRWLAFGVARNDPDDWDISIHSDTAAEPECVLNPPLASSSSSGVVDFVVGDFTHNTGGTYYAKAFQTPEASAGIARWSSKPNLLQINDEPLVVNQDVTQFLDCYTVSLEAGEEYTITFERTAGTNAKFFLFRNPADDTFWSNRAGATLEDSMTTTYMAPAKDWYGIVVVNDIGNIGTYTLGVGSCISPRVLESGVARLMQTHQNYFEMDQQAHFWTAVGYRLPGTPPSLDIYGAPSGLPYPECFGDHQGGSIGTNWDAAVMAANCGVGATPVGKYYAYAPLAVDGAFGIIEWDSGQDIYDRNDPPITRTTGSGEVIEIWNVWFQTSAANVFYFTTTGEADLNLLLFHNPGGASGWYDRSGALFERTGNFPYNHGITEAAWYGLAVVNDNGKSGTYTFSVNTCIQPAELEDGDVDIITGQAIDVPYWLVASQPVWAAIGIRGPDDWDLPIYEHASGSPTPVCLSGLVKTGQQPNDLQKVELVVGDFHRNTLGDFYPRPHRDPSSQDAAAQWDYSREPIIPNGPLLDRNVFPDDVLDIYDMFLIEGNEYQVIFNLTGDADSKLVLFKGSGETYWGDRSEAELEIGSSSSYTPTVTGYYGVVIVNDNGGSGTYQVGATSATVAAGPGAVPVGANIRALVPNPTGGSLTIQFDLGTAARVGFDIFDVAGRVVTRIPAQEWAAGSWTETWNGMMREGTRVGAGVYFVRMRVGGQPAGVKRLVVIE